MTSFTDILNTPFDDIKTPDPLPPGQYLAIIDGEPEITQRGRKETQCVIFTVKPIQALDQNPNFQDELNEALAGKNLSDIRLETTMWLTPSSAYRLKSFLVDHLGIEARNPMQALAMASGRQLIITTDHRFGKEGRVYTDIVGTARA